MPDMTRLIAFYLPQFHPIPENDQWWGKGFTEWRNASKAQPLFPGHYQPQLPADLGFYDLRVDAVRREQEALAAAHGISGFCYHYYWFSGKRLLEQPLDAKLADATSTLPFCLCWANENWTRRWDAADHQVLIEQLHREGDDAAFAESLLPYLRDPRYIRVDGKPLVLVYRPQALPDAARSTGIWRDAWRAAGIGEVHLAAALTHGNRDFTALGFDSGTEFPPHNIDIDNINTHLSFHGDFKGSVFQFADLANSFLHRDYGGARVFRTVFPSWDNTARTGERAVLMLNGTPENYEYWLAATLDRQTARGGEDPVFINAWNEWAEGCHLEPDLRHGHAFLEATQRVLAGERRFSEFPHQALPEAAAQAPRGFWRDLGGVFRYHLWLRFGNFKLAINRHPRLRKLLLALGRFWHRLFARGA